MSSDPTQDLPSRDPGRECAHCGAPLRAGQDWCLSCGRGAPGAFASGTPGWRSAGVVASAVAVLLAGTAVAAVAALDQHSPPAAPVLAQTPPPTTPAAALPTGPTGPAEPTTAAPTAGTPAPTKPVPSPAPAKSKPVVSRPAPAPVEQHPATAAAPAPGAETAGRGREGPKTGAPVQSKPESLLLDTNAATAYNPCRYPAPGFGTPYEAIDGEPTSAWRAVIEPGAKPEGPPLTTGATGPTGATGATGPTARISEAGTGSGSTTGAGLCQAPATGVGLALDLTAPQRVASIALDTSTPGMTVAVYGTSAEALSTSTSWTRLATARQIKKTSATIKLSTAANSYRFVLVWISKAPFNATRTKAGRVAIDEVELFPPAASG
jgi:hypothetical protein